MGQTGKGCKSQSIAISVDQYIYFSEQNLQSFKRHIHMVNHSSDTKDSLSRGETRNNGEREKGERGERRKLEKNFLRYWT